MSDHYDLLPRRATALHVRLRIIYITSQCKRGKSFDTFREAKSFASADSSFHAENPLGFILKRADIVFGGSSTSGIQTGCSEFEPAGSELAFDWGVSTAVERDI